MAVRTSADSVRAILGKNYDLTTTLTPFIVTASVMVDWVQSLDVTLILSATLLERIECWLAAHFYAHADPLYKQKQTFTAMGTFQGETGQGFASTQYGQTAMDLDITGALARRQAEVETGKSRKVGAVWLGTGTP